MAYRYSDTLKWQDEWFVDLPAMQKLLFLYLCDNCDIAGFCEVSYRKISFDVNAKEAEIKGAIKGLERGLIFSNDEKCVLVKNFIKHQKNLPINPENKSHQGIIKRYSMYHNKFPTLELDYTEGYILQGATKPLPRGTGNNIGNGIGIKNITSIEERIEKFKKSLFPFIKTLKNPNGLYNSDMVKDFFEYWTEPNKSGNKFKQELEDTWSTTRRLKTWSSNGFGEKHKKTIQGELVYEEVNNKIDHSNRI